MVELIAQIMGLLDKCMTFSSDLCSVVIFEFLLISMVSPSNVETVGVSTWTCIPYIVEMKTQDVLGLNHLSSIV